MYIDGQIASLCVNLTPSDESGKTDGCDGVRFTHKLEMCPPGPFQGVRKRGLMMMMGFAFAFYR